MITTTAPVTTAKCTRCNRTLRSAKSIALGMGPTCAAKAAAETTPAVAEKFTMIETTSGNVHGLVEQRDGSYRLACTPDSEKLPKGEMLVAGTTREGGYVLDGVEHVTTHAVKVICNRCNHSRGFIGR